MPLWDVPILAMWVNIRERLSKQLGGLRMVYLDLLELQGVDSQLEIKNKYLNWILTAASNKEAIDSPTCGF